MAFISNYEHQYLNNLSEIMYRGFKSLNTRTGILTSRIASTNITIDLSDEFPILKSKNVNWKSATEEILWIMQTQSNNTKDLKPKIWDKWADEDGSIGKSYGYQAAKNVTIGGCTYESQVHYVLETLETDPSSRRAVIDLWNVEDLGDMNLVPCCYSTVWNIIDDHLNCMLTQRSADYPVGVPFDTTQYAVLLHLFARHLGVKPGLLTHNMADSHVYMSDDVDQTDGVNTQFDQGKMIIMEEADEKILNCKPSIWLNPEKKNFFDFTIDDINIDNYYAMPAIKFPVAV